MAKPIFFTDGKGEIFLLEGYTRSASLKNVVSGERTTAQIQGANIEGFILLNLAAGKAMPNSKADAPKAPGHRKPRGISANKYYGVSKVPTTGRFRGQVWFKGENHNLGCFIDEVEAAKKVDAFLVSKGLPKRNFP